MARSVDKSDVKAAREELADSLRRVLADAEELLGATSEEAGDAVADLRARLADNLEQARDKLQDTEAVLRANAQEVAASADEYVRENPWSSLGMAAAAGLVLGVLLGRR